METVADVDPGRTGVDAAPAVDAISELETRVRLSLLVPARFDERELEIVTEDRSFLTLDLQQAKDSQVRVLEDFGVGQERSQGLR